MYRAFSGFAALFFLAGCASGPSGEDQRPPSGFNGAARLVDQGRYGDALPILRCIAKQGEGFEIAQYLAGHSALALSHDDTTPAILRDEMRVEGFDRLLAAGNAGWPAAQAELAEAFAAIGTTEALVEAAYWASIYRSNLRERTYGLDRLDATVEADIVAQLDADGLAAARGRSGEFAITPLPRETMTPECAPHVRSGRNNASDGGQRRGRRGGGNRPQGGGRAGGPGGL
ncbi:hypothetical protein [Maricaulis sp. W15]|uniref:hypothetical protein n=1 Tax=Maricaulis sp. W15 TaxID=1772333 RepID=UPI001300FF9E|nr:hypothetical protein [Maricaulis sp. W15]